MHIQGTIAREVDSDGIKVLYDVIVLFKGFRMIVCCCNNHEICWCRDLTSRNKLTLTDTMSSKIINLLPVKNSNICKKW